MLEWMMKAKKIEIDKSLTSSFSDVKTSNKYYYYIANAESKKIIT